MLLVAFMTGSVEASGEQLFGLTLEELLKIKVTSSTRTEETLQTVPSAITVFTHEQLEQMGANYLHEILALVPGFQVQRDAESPMSYSYSARGRRKTGQSKEILLLIDGTPVNDPRNGAANAAMPYISLEFIEKIEVIRGPGSALYGANAFTGVINISTRTNVNETGIQLGSLSRRQAYWIGEAKFNEWKFNWNIYSLNDSGDSYNLDDNFSADPAIRINTRDPLQLRRWDFAASNVTTELRYIKHTAGSQDFYAIETLNNEVNVFNFQSEQFSFRHRIAWSEQFQSEFQLSLLTGGQTFALQLIPAGELFAVSNPPGSDAMITYVSLDGKTSLVKWLNEWQFSETKDIQFGFEWLENAEEKADVKNNYDLQQLAQQDYPINYYGDFSHITKIGTEGKREASAIYAQYLQSFDNGYELTLGARYDKYNDVGDYFSPRVALVKSIGEQSSMKMLYGEAFRAPALSETQLINNPVALGTPGLKHEIVKTWDLIWVFGGRQNSVTLDLFHNRYINPINIEIVSGNIRQYQNVASESSSGIEMELSHQLTEHWQMRETLTYFNQLPKISFREADTLASLLINYHRNVWNWNLTAAYVGNKAFLSGESLVPLGSYWIINSKFIYQFPEQWSLALQVKNLQGEQYQDSVSGNRLLEGNPNRGREIQLALSKQF